MKSILSSSCFFSFLALYFAISINARQVRNNKVQYTCFSYKTPKIEWQNYTCLNIIISFDDWSFVVSPWIIILDAWLAFYNNNTTRMFAVNASQFNYCCTLAHKQTLLHYTTETWCTLSSCVVCFKKRVLHSSVPLIFKAPTQETCLRLAAAKGCGFTLLECRLKRH